LLVAAKAIDCVFSDEVQKPRELIRSLIPGIPNPDLRRLPIIALSHRLHSMITLNGCGRAILNLEGGIHEKKLDLDLSRDDVYEENDLVGDIRITPDSMLEIVNRNNFKISKTLPSGTIDGHALYYVPSFFNHGCMSNAIHYTYGDMIFFISSTGISVGAEILSSYTQSGPADTYEDRARLLQGKKIHFGVHATYVNLRALILIWLYGLWNTACQSNKCQKMQ